MPRTVLVVDDERDTNDILANLVQARGFEPIQVFSGAQALATIAEKKPDLILLDLMLPDIDGFEFCDRLKRARETNLIPIIMVTALQDAHHRAAGVRVGANGYLTKPFTPRQLYEMIDAGLAWHEEHQQRGTTGEINFDVRSELTYLSQASDMLADLFAHTPLTDRHVKDLKQAVMEMGGNAIEWGHRKNADLVLRITYRIDPYRGDVDHQGPRARLQSPATFPMPPRRKTRSATSRSATRWDIAKGDSGSCSPGAWSTSSVTTEPATRSPWSSTSTRKSRKADRWVSGQRLLSKCRPLNPLAKLGVAEAGARWPA